MKRGMKDPKWYFIDFWKKSSCLRWWDASSWVPCPHSVFLSRFNLPWLGDWSGELTQNIPCTPDASMAKSARGPLNLWINVYIDDYIFCACWVPPSNSSRLAWFHGSASGRTWRFRSMWRRRANRDRIILDVEYRVGSMPQVCSERKVCINMKKNTLIVGSKERRRCEARIYARVLGISDDFFFWKKENFKDRAVLLLLLLFLKEQCYGRALWKRCFSLLVVLRCLPLILLVAKTSISVYQAKR